LDQHRRCRNVLASAIEDRGLLAPFIIDDAAVDVVSPLPGRSAITASPLLLLEGGSKLLQEESVLLDLGLKLTELLQVYASKLLGGGDARYRWQGPCTWRHGIGRPSALIARARHSESDVETLMNRVVSILAVGIGMAEAVVASPQGRESRRSLLQPTPCPPPRSQSGGGLEL